MTTIHILPLISMLFVLFFGLFVFLRNWHSYLNFLFMIFTIANAVWFFGTFMMFRGTNVLFWDKFVYCGVIFIPSTVYHFSTVFVEQSKKYKGIIAIGYALSLGFLLLNVFTGHFVDDVWHYEWGAHSQARFFHHLFLVFFAVYLSLFYFVIIKHYRRAINTEERNRTRYVLLSFFFLTMGAIGFLPAYNISVYPVAYFSGLLFSVAAGYAIMRYDFLGVRDFTYQILVIFINIIAVTQIITSQSKKEYIGQSLFAILVMVLSYVLLKNMSQEYQQKQQLIKIRNDLARANAELKKLDASKSEFISIASHQLRTPLTAIKGYISLILEGAYGHNADKTQDALNKIFMANERLIQLVEDMLNLTRIESGRLEYKMENGVHLEDIVNEIKDVFTLRAQEKQLEFIIAFPDKPLPTITADRMKLREVISNVVDNAMKYTEKGFVRVSAEDRGTFVRIIVEDSGMGISQESLKTLFTKFSRGTDSTKTYTDGTGLGLYVGKNLIESQGGRIYAESDGAGKGTRFIIEMPVTVQ